MKKLFWNDLPIALKLFITVFLFSVLFFKPNLSFSRFAHLTKAMIETNKTSIDEIENKYQIFDPDSFEFKGKMFIQPTPGLSVIALSSYVPYHAFIKPKISNVLGQNYILEFKLSQFLMALSTVSFFSALLVAVFFLVLRNEGCPTRKSVLYALVLYFATPVMFYSSFLDTGQNLLETALFFISFYFLRSFDSINIPRAVLSGLFAGLSIFANASIAPYLILGPLAILLTQRANLIPWMVGSILGAAPLLIYNTISFGNPFLVSYVAQKVLLKINIAGWLKVASTLLLEPQTGLLFFAPFLALLIPMAHALWRRPINRVLLIASAVFVLGLTVQVYSVIQSLNVGEKWYLNQGGGGPRYLLPIIPFLVYLLALQKLSAVQKNVLSFLIPASLLINLPGLFCYGGPPFFLNHLVLFLKNGFHSYLIDLIGELLLIAGYNISKLSLWPVMTIAVFSIWWLWSGRGKIFDALTNDTEEVLNLKASSRDETSERYQMPLHTSESLR